MQNYIMNCQCCGENQIHFKKTFYDDNFYTCQICQSLKYISEDLNIENIYDDSYFINGEYLNYLKNKKIHELNFKKKINILIKYTDLKEINILEVGSAYGFFLNQISKKLNVKNKLGIEVNQNAVNYANSNYGDYFIKSTKYIKPKFNFNLIVCLDVYEHLVNPFDYFNQIISDLDTNGYILIQTVNYSSLNAQLRRKKWRHIHPPSHLNYPTKKGIIKGLSKMGAKIIKHKNMGMYRGLGTYFDALNIKINLGEHFPVYFNLYDIQLILAKKII